MSTLDLTDMSLDELKQLKKDVEKAIKSFEARKKKEALAAAQRAAEEMGFNLAELTGELKGKTVTAPKYQHPENPTVTWTGRGRKPKWFVEAIDSGKTAEEMAIA